MTPASTKPAVATPDLHDLVIKASAGAGKTYALSNRYLTLLRQGATPGHILATTFTRKAAGEILGRVLQRLAEAATDPDKAANLGTALKGDPMDLAEARQLLASLGQALASVSVCTIDSFFNRMVMCFRYELGLPAAPRLVDEGGPVARQLRRRAIEAMLGDDDVELLVQLLRRLHHDQAKRGISDTLDAMIVDLYDLYRQTEGDAWRQLAVPSTLDETTLAAAIAQLESVQPLLPDNKTWHKAWRKDLDQAMQWDWRGFLAGGLSAACQKDDPIYSRKAVPAAVVQAYHPLIVHARASIVAQVAERTAAMRDLLERFDAHYRQLCDEQRVMMFSDLPHLLTRAWQDADASLDELYFRLDGRVQHLLLDEFQDTSPAQWRILRPFAEEIRAGGEEPRSFFCVGDVKQSIYGWRGGCPEVFDAVIEDLHLPGEAVRTIARSYRTSQVVLDVVNRVFGQLGQCDGLTALVEPCDAWSAGFKTHVAARTELPGYVEMLATSPPSEPEEGSDDPEDADDPGAAHLWGVADHVAQLIARHPGRSIGVLTRTNRTAAELIRLLQTLGVPASGEGGSLLHTDPAVEVVLSALTLADHPGHTAAAFHVLHSPLGAIVELGSLDRRDRDAAARAIRQDLLDHGYAGVIGRWTRQLAAHCNRRSVDRLTQLVEMAEAYDPAVTLRVRDFVEHVRCSPVEEPAAAAVRVMTVHRAKGLEFDACVLCEMDGLIGQVSKQLVWTLRDRPVDPPRGVYASVNKDLRETLEAYDASIADAYAQELRRRVADDLSAMYVAMTRPKHALSILLKPLKPTKSGWSSVGRCNASPAAILRQTLMADPVEPIEGLLFATGDPDWSGSLPSPSAALAPTANTPSTLSWPTGTAPRRSWAVVNPSALEDGGAVDVDRVLQLGSRSSRAHGSAVHEQLAAIPWLDETGAPGPALSEVLAHPAVQEALRKPGDDAEVWIERPFVVRVGGQLLRGALDRVVIRRDPDGRATSAWLIDFKTDRPDPAAVERYRPQLQAYRRAIAAMLRLDPPDVQATLLFVHTGEAVDL